MSTPDDKCSKSPGSRDLTEDVILEILLRLPVKSLVRLKCVCKQWYAIVESQSFIEQHFGHRSNQERLLVHHYKHNEDRYAYALFVDDTSSGFEEPAHLQMPNMISQLLGPVNGVFCLVGESSNLALLNPATRHLRPLSKLPEVIVEPHQRFSRDVHGFGLDPLSGDYKVVSIRTLHNIYLNGIYYWTMECTRTHVFALLAFDMTTEKFQEIQVPDCLKLKCWHLTFHHDSITLLSYDLERTSWEVWVMEKEGSWNRVAVVGPYLDMTWVLGLWKDNELVIRTDTSFLMLCNIFTHKRQLIHARAVMSPSSVHWIFSYKESLVSIKGNRDNCVLWDASPDILTVAWANADQLTSRVNDLDTDNLG